MNLVDTIKNAFVPIHREGYVFIGGFAVATLLLGVFSTNLFWIGLILTAWCAYFFRDPEPRHAGRRPAGGEPCRWRGVGGRLGRPAARAWPRRRRDDAHLGFHECLLLPCEPRAGAWADRQDRAPAGQIPECRTRQGEPGERAQRPGHRQPQRPVAAVQIAGLVARRIVCWVDAAATSVSASVSASSASARASTFSCRRRDAARRGRPDGGRRRDGARRIRRRRRHAAGPHAREKARSSRFEPHGRGGPRIREIPLRLVLPNLITVLAICAGLSGIRLAFEARFETAVMMVLIAAFLDGIDGRLARMLQGDVEIWRANGFAGRHRQFRRRSGAGALCLSARPGRLAGLDRGAAVRHRLRASAGALQCA